MQRLPRGRRLLLQLGQALEVLVWCMDLGLQYQDARPTNSVIFSSSPDRWNLSYLDLSQIRSEVVIIILRQAQW